VPSLGLAMIVKNGAKTLRECVLSVAGVTDQIVIVDTGSSDGTPQLARDLGAQVFDFSWQDDFAQARNAAVKALATDWVLVMDDDEELDPPARDKIPHLLNDSTSTHSRANPSRVGGYNVTLRNYIPFRFGVGGNAPSFKPIGSTIPRAARARSYADFTICRLFRRHPEIYYVGRVHEMVEPRIRALGLEIRPANLVIRHFGILCSPQERRMKNELYRKLGWLKVRDLPNDPQAWVEIGLQEFEQFKNYSAGIECFKKALALDPNFSTTPYLALANLYVEIRSDARALELLSGKAMSGRAAGEKEQICGDAFYNLGRLKEARSAYMRALRILSDDVRIVSKLGLTEVRLGLKKNGIARLIRALNAAPDVLEMHERVIKAHLVMNRRPQAAEAAERLAAEFPNPVAILRAASIRAHSGEWKAAEDFVLRGLQLFPESDELLQAKAEFEKEPLRSPGRIFAASQNPAYCTTGLSEERGLSRP
jgi:glycosyltransferase involved in cell wall biosynthesis